MQPKSKAQTAKVFRDFCESTTLHGYSYLYIATSILMKIIWMIVIVSMTALGIGFVVNNTNDYLEAKILTTIESSTAPLDVRNIQVFNPQTLYKINHCLLTNPHLKRFLTGLVLILVLGLNFESFWTCLPQLA